MNANRSKRVASTRSGSRANNFNRSKHAQEDDGNDSSDGNEPDALKQDNHLEDYLYEGRNGMALLKNCKIVTVQKLQGEIPPRQNRTYLVKLSVLLLVVTPQLEKIFSIPNMPKITRARQQPHKSIITCICYGI